MGGWPLTAQWSSQSLGNSVRSGSVDSEPWKNCFLPVVLLAVCIGADAMPSAYVIERHSIEDLIDNVPALGKQPFSHGLTLFERFTVNHAQITESQPVSCITLRASSTVLSA